MFNFIKFKTIGLCFFKKAIIKKSLIFFLPTYALLYSNLQKKNSNSFFSINYYFKLNLRYVYGFNFNNKGSYFFSQNFKIKKYNASGFAKITNKLRVLASFKYLFFLYLHLFNKLGKTLMYLFFSKVNISFYLNLDLFFFLFLKFKKNGFFFFYNISSFFNKKYFKRKSSIKKKRKVILKKQNVSNLLFINSRFFSFL